MYDHLTAVELAFALDALGGFQHATPDRTDVLWALDLATDRWALQHPEELALAQWRFTQARIYQWPRPASPEAWEKVLGAARALAAELRKFGDIALTN